jgi:hypothetical protein
LQITCIFSPPSHTQSLFLSSLLFLWRSLYIKHVLSPASLSQNWISFHFLFSMKKKLNISCVFFSHCCFLISCHHGMFFLDLSLFQLSFNLFLFVFYEEESWGSYVFALKSLSHISHTYLIMLCVFPPPSLSQLEISSLFGFYEEGAFRLCVFLSHHLFQYNSPSH